MRRMSLKEVKFFMMSRSNFLPGGGMTILIDDLDGLDKREFQLLNDLVKFQDGESFSDYNLMLKFDADRRTISEIK